MILLELFISFFSIGAINFGGGLSIIPLLTGVLTSKGWMSEAQIIDMIAISEITPGPIGINLATYAGYETGGVLGAVVATFALSLPSFIIIIIIAHLFNKFKNNAYVEGVMKVIRPVVTGMIAAVCVRIAMISLFDFPLFKETGIITDMFSLPGILIAIAVFLLYYKYKVHPVILILSSAVLGMIIF
jgi:chromate transporter